ncbi:MAG: thiol reductant ABC exporter subunit CydC [Acidiphilium sp.]|nr:thiol reductant ABC exporter subunit CydC [Acidiphilium sp.]MDD4937214.1 thiol reductant ABC exporter subunit CydC [Acidiphilium sp.]
MKDLLRLLRLFRPYTLWMLAGIGLAIVVILANVGLLALAGWFITAMALSGLSGQLIEYFTPAAGIRALAVLRTGGRYAERLVTHEATLRLLSALRVWFYQHLEPLAPARLQYYRGGDLLSRIRADIDSLDNLYLRVLVPTAAAAITVLLIFAFMTVFSLDVALVDLAGLILAGIVLPLATQRLARRPGQRAVAIRADLRSGIADAVRGLGELRVYQAAANHAAAIDGLSRDLITQQRRQARISAQSAGLSSLIANLSLGLALVITIPLVAHATISGPDLAMIALFVLGSFEAVTTLPNAFQALGETLAAARRIFEIIDTTPEVVEPSHEAPMPATFDLRIRGLRMRYAPDAPWALDGIDIDIPQGGRLGIVGATGSGKTSLLNVLLRFWDYQDGTVEIGDVALRDLRGETVRAWCAVVAQQTYLFNTSIRQNLLLARPGASDADLCRALRQANIFDEILALPNGLDTFVGETGTRLSGGQARRVAIARAFLKDTPILILDEPTEGLDAVSEHEVLAALETLMQGRTTLLITHRPQSLTIVDRVIVLSHGRILGTPPPLQSTAVAGATLPQILYCGTTR